MRRLSLGLDSSTQGLAAVAVDLDSRETVWKHALDYRADSRLAGFGLTGDYILPPGEPGEANQPAALYFASLEAMFDDLAESFRARGLNSRCIRVINVSGQQHGFVMLNSRAESLFRALAAGTVEAPLASYLAEALAAPYARIWRTACTGEESSFVRQKAGGKQRIIELSGSDAPLRFSAFGIRRTALRQPEIYARTALIHQISSLLPAVLTGNVHIPLDWGNACGTSLMDYREKRWSGELVSSAAEGLPGGGGGLLDRLPALGSALSLAGPLVRHFVERWGFSQDCLVGVGSGDNPQSKVLVQGSLLSLGSSFVIMVETGGATFDSRGYANAMYDGLDRPFSFGCRTNGALRWDRVRALHGIEKKDYTRAEAFLAETPCGNRGRLFLWQAENESFPVSGKLEPLRLGYDTPGPAADYAGIVESSLAAVYAHSRHFTTPGDRLFVTGGPSRSREVLRRVAAIWRREAVPVDQGGAALGAAVSGACALLKNQGEDFDAGAYAACFLGRREPVSPRPEDVAACHGPGGLLERYAEAEKRVLGLG